MTWTKLGDEYGGECWELSDAAFRLHTEGLVWSNGKALDGRLAKDDMVRWARRPGAAEELVACGWWEDRDNHFQVIHHQGYQRTKDEVAHQSNVNRANRAKGKARPVRSKSTDESSDKSSDADRPSDEPSDERDRPGQARTGRTRDHEKNDQYAPGERESLQRKADQMVRDGYDR